MVQKYLFDDLEDEQEEARTAGWNLWHGCTKYSPGCQNCYVFRQDDRIGVDSTIIHKTKSFDMPVKKKRDKSYKYPAGTFFYTCFSSDFLHEAADEWRLDAWRMIQERSDCHFMFFTKRIERFIDCIPPDWGDAYDNVTIGCTCENQEMAEHRLPHFLEYPIKHKIIISEPLLSRIDISGYLDKTIEEVIAGGESGDNARPCQWEWILSLREQCVAAGVPFHFKQTGAKFIKDGRLYSIPRKLQISQARKAGIDYLY